MDIYAPRKTLSPNNQFRFTCPIFQAEVELRTCFALEELHKKGRRHEKRRGCQACMVAGKCPTWHIVQDMYRQGTDPYHADKPTVGSLTPELLRRIHPVLVMDKTMENYDISPVERERILAANRRAADVAPRVEIKRQRIKAQKMEEVREEPSVAPVTAATGDLSEALNRAIAKEAAGG